MRLHQLLPQIQETTIDNIGAQVRLAREQPLPIRAEETIEFCAALSLSLLQGAYTKKFPEFASLGFWLRPASIRRMIEDYLTPVAFAQRMPSGIVFLLPPGNVPTLFLYNLVISLLCGNITVVRLSSRDLPSQLLLVDIITSCLEAAPENLRNRCIGLRYDHDDEITAKLSALCDMRLLWGGDATVTHMRGLPLPPLANEVSFGDRFSACAIDAKSYLFADDEKRKTLVHGFSNDLFLFDQFACASPRLLVWVGAAADVEQAGADFYQCLSDSAPPHLPAGAPLAKLNMTYLALHDLSPTGYRVYNSALTVISLLDLTSLSAFKQVNCGFGLLLTARLDALEELACFAERKDQTLTVWGFSSTTYQTFVAACNGRGFDRIVPVGQALDFSPIWDGHNLFTIMTRLVHNKQLPS